jgi:lipid II:glycine glycyltransferase (peptidoglycan interpeptide bridge formation enzyme)
MIAIRELADADAAAWDALVAKCPSSGFMQSWAWSEFKRLEGYDILRLGVFEGGTLAAGAILFHFPSPQGAGLIAVPDGPVLDWNGPRCDFLLKELLKSARRWSAALGAVALRVEPRLPECPPVLSGWGRSPVDLVPEETLEARLGPEPEMLSRMKPKGRYNARLALRRGVEVELTADASAVHDFHFVLESTGRYHDFLTEPKSFFINLACSLPACARRFAFARYKGMTLAAALMVRFGKTATYLYGGRLPIFPELMASEAMHWEIMRDAAAGGFEIYDLYGYSGPDRPRHPYAAFSRFKEKFGGKAVKRMGSRDLILYDRLADSAVGLLRRASR